MELNYNWSLLLAKKYYQISEEIIQYMCSAENTCHHNNGNKELHIYGVQHWVTPKQMNLYSDVGTSLWSMLVLWSLVLFRCWLYSFIQQACLLFPVSRDAKYRNIKIEHYIMQKAGDIWSNRNVRNMIKSTALAEIGICLQIKLSMNLSEEENILIWLPMTL